MAHDMSAEWQSYIAREIQDGERRAIRAVTEAVGEVLAEERKKLRAEFETRLEAELLKIRIEFLQGQFDQERGTKRHLKAVPPSLIA